ncbi:Bifunctional transcriptional activator/DNA repair enzyme AdaA [Grimontia celer]|uniref:Bifunctional transcriptional activator/DNA repair enzyme AdaA n=1 Tax=Grimontia celer TaxID=1796497 RepID=A0A128F2G2_9GAMM|nr:AraC family transcriptional regulator [Grimontia celer]CZF80983.1 Bifunctional transcriptional activator/DNA repair enzyme AdaA [Grimontia celer]
MDKDSSQTLKRQRVYNVLKDNTARLHNEIWQDNGLGSAVWSNSHGSASYEKPGHHTLSFYLSGGQNTKRCLSGGDMFGGEDKLCLMPTDHRSQWSFADPFSFFHFYFEQKHLQNFAEQVFDKEGRHIELKECTFVDDPFVNQLVRQTMLQLDWESDTDKLMMSHAQQMLLLHLVRRYCQLPLQLPQSQGGLSPQNQRLVMEYIESHLMQSFTLADLATLTQLSEFHFARMFKTSFDCTPHQYVLSRRIARAKDLLQENILPLAEIAMACGFSSQQHLSQQFKQRVGMTPAAFRKAQNRR